MDKRKQDNRQKCKIKKLFSALFAMLLVLTLIQTTANAADNKSGKLNAWEKQVKVGKYYYKSDSSGLYISSKKGKTGTLLLPKNKDGQTYDHNAYFSGNYIYYSYSIQNSKSYLYRMKVNGKSKKMIAEIAAKKEDASGMIEFVYKNQVIYSHSDINGSDVYSINVKTKKVKYLKGYSFSAVNSEQTLSDCYHYKNYYAVDVGGYKGDLYPTEKYIFNAKTQKLKRISKEAWAIAIAGKDVYYLENDINNSCRLMRCDVNGKSKKKLKTIKNEGNSYAGLTFHKVTSKYCIYTSWEGDSVVYYKYTFSTKKTQKVQV